MRDTDAPGGLAVAAFFALFLLHLAWGALCLVATIMGFLWLWRELTG